MLQPFFRLWGCIDNRVGFAKLKNVGGYPSFNGGKVDQDKLINLLLEIQGEVFLERFPVTYFAITMQPSI